MLSSCAWHFVREKHTSFSPDVGLLLAPMCYSVRGMAFVGPGYRCRDTATCPKRRLLRLPAGVQPGTSPRWRTSSTASQNEERWRSKITVMNSMLTEMSHRHRGAVGVDLPSRRGSSPSSRPPEAVDQEGNLLLLTRTRNPHRKHDVSGERAAYEATVDGVDRDAFKNQRRTSGRTRRDIKWPLLNGSVGGFRMNISTATSIYSINRFSPSAIQNARHVHSRIHSLPGRGRLGVPASATSRYDIQRDDRRLDELGWVCPPLPLSETQAPNVPQNLPRES